MNETGLNNSPSAAWDESTISRAILSAYARKLDAHLTADVVIVGAGPAGLTAAYYLAERGLKVTVLEKRLTPGGGIWGGAIGMNSVVVQDAAASILHDLSVWAEPCGSGLFVADAMELGSALCLRAARARAAILNLFTVEDVVMRDNHVGGVVVGRTMICDSLPVDPITFCARVVVDSTGHKAAVVQHLRRRGLLRSGEGPMDAASGERFVVDRVAEVYPGLWVCGMAVCATLAGPRMGPIFGGMLLSGQRLAERLCDAMGHNTVVEITRGERYLNHDQQR
jgi:sulfide-dependent adenosine diphosphate thiazole synthase